MIRSLLLAPLFLAALALAAVSCGPLVTAGDPCTVTHGDCPPSYTCFQKQPSGMIDIPGGFCSRGCGAEGETYQCPSGTVCSFFGDSQLICAPECTSNANCREGYECADVAMGSTAIGNQGGSKKTCRPKGVVK